MLKKSWGGFRSGFQPATFLSSSNAGKMPALQSASRYFFSKPSGPQGTGFDLLGVS
jgi:hypothetical protein